MSGQTTRAIDIANDFLIVDQTTEAIIGMTHRNRTPNSPGSFSAATFAGLPSPANAIPWQPYSVGTVGTVNVWFYTDGLSWYQFNGSTPLISCGIPFILPSNGTMGNNGALSGIVALPLTYPNAYVYCPAGQVYSGSTAGWYYAQGVSTTALTIFNNLYSSGVPTVPSNPTPFVSTGVGTFTTLANSIYLPAISITIPGGVMGNNGKLRSERIHTMSNTANNKVAGIIYGGTTFAGFTLTTSSQLRELDTIWNSGSAGSNVGTAFLAIGGGTGTFTRGSVNTNLAQTYSAAMGIATGAGATDFCVLEHFTLDLWYGQ